MLIRGGLTIAVQMIAVEAITSCVDPEGGLMIAVETIAVEMIAVEHCVSGSFVTFHVHFVHNHEISVPPRHSVRSTGWSLV